MNSDLMSSSCLQLNGQQKNLPIWFHWWMISSYHRILGHCFPAQIWNFTSASAIHLLGQQRTFNDTFWSHRAQRRTLTETHILLQGRQLDSTVRPTEMMWVSYLQIVHWDAPTPCIPVIKLKAFCGGHCHCGSTARLCVRRFIQWIPPSIFNYPLGAVICLNKISYLHVSHIKVLRTFYLNWAAPWPPNDQQIVLATNLLPLTLLVQVPVVEHHSLDGPTC